jgi:hypothetical protein
MAVNGATVTRPKLPRIVLRISAAMNVRWSMLITGTPISMKSMRNEM